jgi:hypothetical protein
MITPMDSILADSVSYRSQMIIPMDSILIIGGYGYGINVYIWIFLKSLSFVIYVDVRVC